MEQELLVAGECDCIRPSGHAPLSAERRATFLPHSSVETPYAPFSLGWGAANSPDPELGLGSRALLVSTMDLHG